MYHVDLMGMLLLVFQYSNVYVATPKLPLLMSNLELQQQCISYVATASELYHYMNMYNCSVSYVVLQETYYHQDHTSY